VGAIGAGMYHTAKLTTLVRETDLDVVRLAGRYTLLEQRALDDLLPACAERGVSVLAAAVFNSGVLAAPRPPLGRGSTTRPPRRGRCSGRSASPMSARRTG
jgi:D-threo-aldose 1-dehydrogenase